MNSLETVDESSVLLVEETLFDEFGHDLYSGAYEVERVSDGDEDSCQSPGDQVVLGGPLLVTVSGLHLELLLHLGQLIK